MKQTFCVSLFIGLGLITSVPSFAKTAPASEKKPATKTVKSNKTETPVAKKALPSKKTELAKSIDKTDKKNSKGFDLKHSKTPPEKANKFSKTATPDSKDKRGKKTPELVDAKDNKHKKAQQLVEAKTKKDSKNDKNDKPSKSKNQQVIEAKEDKHRKKSRQPAVETEQQDDVAETNEAIENSVEQNVPFESEQTAVYEPEPQPVTANNPPLIAAPTVKPAEKPLFSTPNPPVQNNTPVFNATNPVLAQEPKQPLISTPSQVEPNNSLRVQTSINKTTIPQPFAHTENTAVTTENQDAVLPNNKRVHNTIGTRPNNFISDANTQETSAHIISTHGVVEGSLADAGAKAGLSEDMMVELTEVFAWDIDFANNLQAGDKFTLVYDNNASSGNRIVAAEFVNRGKTYRAIRYKNQEGMVSYYAPDGHSLKKAFLTTPVDFARVSSHFSPHRHHPILNRIRAHKGVDYAARVGTPVKAAGDGVVTFRGVQGGYGNMIVISHGEHYETAYAHLSNFYRGLQEGQPVKQGDVIGYVGQTGLATGPHLHYEFRVDGVHKDPEKLDSSQGMRLAGDDWDNFHAQTVPVLLKLNAAKNTSVVAENQPNRPSND